MIQSMIKYRTLPLKARTAIAMFAIGGAVAVASTVLFEPFHSPVRFLILLALAVGTANRKFRLYRDSSISFLTSVTLLSILVAGTTEAILIAICGVGVQTYFPSRKLVPYRLVFNAGMIALTVKASCWIYTFSMMHPGAGLPNQLVAVIAASSVYYLGNSISVSLMIALTTGARMLKLWNAHFAASAPSFLMAGLLSMVASQVTMKLFMNPMLLLILPVVVGSYYFTLRLVESRG
jgi:hypothetical protein